MNIYLKAGLILAAILAALGAFGWLCAATKGYALVVVLLGVAVSIAYFGVLEWLRDRR